MSEGYLYKKKKKKKPPNNKKKINQNQKNIARRL